MTLQQQRELMAASLMSFARPIQGGPEWWSRNPDEFAQAVKECFAMADKILSLARDDLIDQQPGEMT